MANERYVVMKVECQHCKPKQKIHVAASAGGTLMCERTISCLNCYNYIWVTTPDRILRGPFPV
jgi:hypothetical protein